MKVFEYAYKDLEINLAELKAELGFESPDLPEPFGQYLESAIAAACELGPFEGCYTIENCQVTRSKVLLDSTTFNPGFLICREIQLAQKAAFFICTAGKKFCGLAEKISQQDPVEGYVYYLLANFIVERVGDRIGEEIASECQPQGLRATNRFSPGYCKWDVSEQRKLFQLFEGQSCGVSLSDSALMDPVKSISGIIGIGEKVEYRDYQCSLCSMTSCPRRATA